jgi:hypothetical protein
LNENGFNIFPFSLAQGGKDESQRSSMRNDC